MKRLILALALACAACARNPRAVIEPVIADPRAAVLPAPLTMDGEGGPPFRATGRIALVVAPDDRQAAAPAVDVLSTLLHQAGQRVEVADAPTAGVPAIALRIDGTRTDLSSEGYALTIAQNGVELRAPGGAGLFYGVQTMRDLLPTAAEHAAIRYARPRPLVLPALHIVDTPRYAWRGAMLDVARHFFKVEDVERYIDLLALLKMNRLHLHLADDQGWRIQIASRPRLTEIGSTTSVGGGPGGFFTQEQYSEIVRYAAARFVTIVPEIDMPGHTTAALASYPELNAPGAAPVPVYTGVGVTPNALCATCDATYRFVDDVVGELARLTPGPWLHVGGDEAQHMAPADYARFVTETLRIVRAHGKEPIGWDEIAAAPVDPLPIVQVWRPDARRDVVSRAPHIILSPGPHAYLDMKYNATTDLGLTWAGLVSVQRAYEWDPDAMAARPAAVLGVEAPLWAETLTNIREVEYLAFPRLAAIAYLAWAPASAHDWKGFRRRLAGQAPRWTALGINFFRDPEIFDRR